MPNKKTLFDQGVAAASAVFGTRGVYPCPLCKRAFTQDHLNAGQLSLEDVPPESIGGWPLLLTCRECNSTAGHEVDVHAANRDRLIESGRLILSGEEGSAGRVSIEAGGHSIRADLTNLPGLTELRAVPGGNDPKTVEAFSRVLTGGNTDGMKINLSIHARADNRRADLSLLRAAYLALTAKFGYTYAFHVVLDIVREQINNPDRIILKHWMAADDRAVDEPIIGFCAEEGLAVMSWRKRLINLPWVCREGLNYVRRMDEAANNAAQMNIKLRSYEWPTSFEALLDHRPKAPHPK